MESEIESIEAVSRAVDRIVRRGRLAEFELTNGIVLTIKPVPPLLINAINQEFQEQLPAPPKILIEEKGREEENPNDPEYLRQIGELAERQQEGVANLLLGVGTEIKFVPDDMFKPDDEGWVQQVQFAAELANKQLEIPSDGVKRYLCWLRFYAMESNTDVALCQGLCMQLAGIREGEIEEVVESFRSLPQRGTDSHSEVEGIRSNGYTGNRADRRSSARNRGA